jgi:Holliday junction resolvase
VQEDSQISIESKIMPLYESGDIGAAGEKHATAALIEKGWTCVQNTQQAGATDIQATAGGKTMLVQVKTAVCPAFPADISPEERTRITGRAARNGYEAWLCQVRLNPNGSLAWINWQKLS